MSEQELRDRLRAQVDSVEAPADLAGVAEKGWRRRRRNRALAAGATLAVLAVVGGVVVALPRPAPAPVAAVPGPGGEGCVELPAPPAQVPAPATAALTGRTYRGDLGLKARTLALAPADLRATAVPLLGLRTVTETSPNAWVYALALRQPAGWFVQIGAAEEHDGQVLPIDDVLLPLAAKGPISAFVSLTGGFFGGPAGGALVVLGRSDTQRIDYLGCRDGRTFATGTAGDHLVLTTGPLEEAGRLTVQVGGRTIPAGRPQDVSRLPLAPPASADLSGHGDKLADTQLQLVADERTRTVRFESDGKTPDRAPAVVLAVCAGRGSVRFGDAAVPCDGRTHEVWTGTLDFSRDSFRVTGVPDPSTGRTSLSVALTVVSR
jgi:hypothetical protein